MKRTKQSTFAKRERREQSTGFAPVGGEDMSNQNDIQGAGECPQCGADIAPRDIAKPCWDCGGEVMSTHATNGGATHTPGPLHNGQPSLGQPCTCCILLRTGEPLESIHGKQPCADISRIELCPKHAAAPAMYEAIRKVIEHRAKDYLDNSVEPYYSLVVALAQAEGRQP